MSGQALDDGITAGLAEHDLKKVELDEKRDWAVTDTYEHEAITKDGHIVTKDGLLPTEEEMHGPNKLRRVSDSM